MPFFISLFLLRRRRIVCQSSFLCPTFVLCQSFLCQSFILCHSFILCQSFFLCFALLRVQRKLIFRNWRQVRPRWDFCTLWLHPREVPHQDVALPNSIIQRSTKRPSEVHRKNTAERMWNRPMWSRFCRSLLANAAIPPEWCVTSFNVLSPCELLDLVVLLEDLFQTRLGHGSHHARVPSRQCL